MKRFLCAALALGLAAVSHGAWAQSTPWSVELNGAKVDDLSGAELGLGYSWSKNGFRLTPVVGALLYKGDNDRYRTENLSNGRTICRDRTNGHFADKANCDDTAAKAYGKIEAAYSFQRVEIGGGVRISDDATPYGLLGLNLSPQIQVKAFAGRDYYGAGLNARF